MIKRNMSIIGGQGAITIVNRSGACIVSFTWVQVQYDLIVYLVSAQVSDDRPVCRVPGVDIPPDFLGQRYVVVVFHQVGF